MTSKVTRARASELEAIAAALVLPDRCTDVCMVAGYEDGHDVFGPAWSIDGGVQKVPIAMFESQRDGRALFALIAGPGGELWQRREARRARIAELEAQEAAAEAEAKELEKEQAKLRRKAEGGGGSSRPEPSSEKRTGGTRTRVEETLLSSLRASARTSLALSSSSRARSRGSSTGNRGRTTVRGSVASA